MLLGSVTELTREARGRHVVVGSHGGPISARHAILCGVASLICHDAGIGKDAAGVRSLDWLQAAGIPAAAVGHMSACIGDPVDMLARGVISRANPAAQACGVLPGMAAAAAFESLSRCPPPPATACEPPPAERRRTIGASRRRVAIALDSASMLEPGDDGAIVVTGSHGGLPGNAAARAAKARPLFVSFNDAGRGIDDAGVRRIVVLGELGLAAAAVDAWTARIGDALSHYETGVISFANPAAAALGATVGRRLRDVVDGLLAGGPQGRSNAEDEAE